MEKKYYGLRNINTPIKWTFHFFFLLQQNTEKASNGCVWSYWVVNLITATNVITRGDHFNNCIIGLPKIRHWLKLLHRLLLLLMGISVGWNSIWFGLHMQLDGDQAQSEKEPLQQSCMCFYFYFGVSNHHGKSTSVFKFLYNFFILFDDCHLTKEFIGYDMLMIVV